MTKWTALRIGNGNAESAEIFLNNNGDETALEYCVYTGKLVESYLPTILLNRYSVKIEKGFCGYKKLKLNAENLQDKKVYIKFLKHNSIYLGVTEQELTGALSFTENDDPTAGIYIDGVGMKITPHENICFKNVLPNQNLYTAENLVNGYNRPEGLPYSWVSADKNDTVVELEYREPKYISEIQLVFNDNLKTDTRRNDMKTLIKDYFIFIDDEAEEVRDNILRVNKFSIGRYIKKIRIVPLSNYGAAKFEIFGIRIN